MNNWNYRIMRTVQKTPTGEEATYGFHEVYYREDDSIEGWTEDPCAPMGETFDELSNDLARMLAAMTRPVLDNETGREIGPAPRLVDDLNKMLADEKAAAGKTN